MPSNQPNPHANPHATPLANTALQNKFKAWWDLTAATATVTDKVAGSGADTDRHKHVNHSRRWSQRSGRGQF